MTTASWSPVGRGIDDILAERPRRQSLPGFDPIYSDIVDYILRCTHRIWEEKNVGLIESHYGADCALHTLAGPVRGAPAVIANTLATLAAFPDRTLIGEDVIWSEDRPGTFYTSHRIASVMTHLGDDPTFGPATGRRALIHTIADCVCVENRIVEEWLVRDNGWLCVQLGLDLRALAARQASEDRARDPSVHAWREAEIARVRAGGAASAETSLALAWRSAIEARMLGDAARRYAEAAELAWPTGRRGFGRAGFIGLMTQLLAPLTDVAFSVDHVSETPLPDGDTASAMRWTLTGSHRRGGAKAAANDRALLILGITHARLRNGFIIEERTIFDDLAIARQMLGGLGA